MGGDEVLFFVGEFFCMYLCYFEDQGWKIDVFDFFEFEVGGIKEVLVIIEGCGVYSWLKYEGGVYWVQCVFEMEVLG